MITNIIDILLIIGILYMLYIIYQIAPYYFNEDAINTNNQPNTNHMPINNPVDNNVVNNINMNLVNNKLNLDDEIMPPTQHGFHDHFAKSNGFETNQYLGWRYWYLKNRSNYMVKPTGNFDNISTNNYLSGLENTHNWFENLDENTDIEEIVIE